MPGKLNRIRKVKWRKRMNKHGFFNRMKSAKGRSVLARRRKKGRKVIVVQRRKRS